MRPKFQSIYWTRATKESKALGVFSVVPSALLLVLSFTNEGANVAANRLHAAAVFDVQRLLSFVFYCCLISERL